MTSKGEYKFELIGSVILTLIVSSISRSISGIDNNWTIKRFIVFIFIGYIIFFVMGKLINLVKKLKLKNK